LLIIFVAISSVGFVIIPLSPSELVIDSLLDATWFLSGIAAAFIPCLLRRVSKPASLLVFFFAILTAGFALLSQSELVIGSSFDAKVWFLVGARVFVFCFFLEVVINTFGNTSGRRSCFCGAWFLLHDTFFFLAILNIRTLSTFSTGVTKSSSFVTIIPSIVTIRSPTTSTSLNVHAGFIAVIIASTVLLFPRINFTDNPNRPGEMGSEIITSSSLSCAWLDGRGGGSWCRCCASWFWAGAVDVSAFCFPSIISRLLFLLATAVNSSAGRFLPTISLFLSCDWLDCWEGGSYCRCCAGAEDAAVVNSSAGRFLPTATTAVFCIAVFCKDGSSLTGLRWSGCCLQHSWLWCEFTIRIVTFGSIDFSLDHFIP